MPERKPPASPWTSPAELLARLRKRWLRGELLAARATGAQPFPMELPLRQPSAADIRDRFGEVMDWAQSLRAQSRETCGHGYELRWARAGNRVQGTNELPVAAVIRSAEDALRLLHVKADAARFDAVLAETRARHPALVPWLARRPMLALESARDWPRLLTVVDYFLDHPRPGRYLRQLEIPEIDSKFIEQRRGLLGELLDAVLPPTAIDRNARGAAAFLRRYGLRPESALVRFRVLDPAIAVGGLTDLSVPAEDFAALAPRATRVFITENTVNGLAMPACPGSLVVFGLGYGLERLAEVEWLRNAEVWYWGDLDTHGFGILNRLRAILPDARSFLMTREVLLAHRPLWGTEPPERRFMGEPRHLHVDERALLEELRSNQLGDRVRLEQERVGFGWVRAAVDRIAPPRRG